MQQERLVKAQKMLDHMMENTSHADGSKGFLLRELIRMVTSRRAPLFGEIPDMMPIL